MMNTTFHYKLLFFLLTILIIIGGCADDSEKNIIPRKELIPVLVDIHLMDAMLSDIEYREQIIQSDTADYYKAVIRQHGYSKAQFDSSISYYSQDLKKFDKIYQEVLVRLSKLETEAQEKIREKREEKEKLNEQTDSTREATGESDQPKVSRPNDIQPN
jgi:hypothetical protein